MEKLLKSLREEQKEYQRVVLVTTLIDLILILLFISLPGTENFMTFFLILLLALSGLIVGKYRNRYRTTYKEVALRNLFNLHYGNITYEHSQGIEKETFLKTRMYRRPDRYGAEDYIRGEIHGVPFISSDIHAQERRGSGKIGIM